MVKERKIEFWTLIFLSMLVGVLFFDGSLDLKAGGSFYHPDQGMDSWPEQNRPMWLFFYHGAPWLTGALLFLSLLSLIGALFKPEFKKLRMQAIMIFMVILLGAGFIINGVLKPYWGRPRPREVQELGGNYEFKKFYQMDLGAQGKSFPCGHCSVGFTYGLFYWTQKRKNRKSAILALVISLFLGLSMGMGRMAAGGHFLSDVLIAGLIVYWVCYLTYYKILNIPQKDLDEQKGIESDNKFLKSLSQKSPRTLAIYSALGLLTILVLLVATPFHKPIYLDIKEDIVGTEAVLEVDQGTVLVFIDDAQSEKLKLDGSAKGFGFPGNKIKSSCQIDNDKTTCKVTRKGLFSDYESSMNLFVNTEKLRSLKIKVNKGQVQKKWTQTLRNDFQLQVIGDSQ